MAEKIFNFMAAEKQIDAAASSCGVAACEGEPMSANAAAALREIGVNNTEHTSRQLTEDILQNADLIIAMTRAQTDILRRFQDAVCIAEYNGGKDISDPYGMPVSAYRKTAQELINAIEKIVAALETEKKS